MEMVKMILAFLVGEAFVTFGILATIYAFKTAEPPMSRSINPQVWLFFVAGPMSPYLFELSAREIMGRTWVAAHTIALYTSFISVALVAALPLAIWWGRLMYRSSLKEYEDMKKAQKRKELGLL